MPFSLVGKKQAWALVLLSFFFVSKPSSYIERAALFLLVSDTP